MAIDNDARSLRGNLPMPAEDLPHGLITAPPEVRERLAQHLADYPGLSEESRLRTLNEWTLAYHFEHLCHEVLYRPTPEGPDVVTVGTDEVITLKKTTPIEEQRQLKTFLGY
jgi:hypothetical protein